MGRLVGRPPTATTVLSNDPGVYPAETYRPEADSKLFYFSYRNRTDTMFPVAQPPVLNDTVGGQSLVIVTPDQGADPRAYKRDSPVFREGALTVNGTFMLVDESGVTWV